MSKTTSEPTTAPSKFVTTDTGEVLDALEGLVRYAHRLSKATAARPSLMVLGEGEIDYIVPAKILKTRAGEEVPVRFFGLRMEVFEKDGKRVICPVKCSAWGQELVEATMDLKRGSRVALLGFLGLAPNAGGIVPAVKIREVWLIE